LNNKNELTNKISVVSRLTASKSTAAFEFQDPDSLTDLLTALQAINVIQLACAYDEDSILVAQYKKTPELICLNTSRDVGTYLIDNYLEVVEPSIQLERRVGTIVIQASLNELTENTLISILMMFGV